MAASPCPAAALVAVKVCQQVEAAALLAEALRLAIAHDAADLRSHNGAQQQ
jgi:hypothetical protein